MNQIQNKIEETERLLALARQRFKNFNAIVSAAKDDIQKYEEFALETNVEICNYEEQIYELNIEKQLEETIWPASNNYVVKNKLNANAEPFSPAQKRFKAEAVPFYPPRAEGTKLKWILNDETYRVAIVKKDSILEVKVVMDGHGYCHDIEFCMCKPCNNINDYLSQPIRPFPVRLPLIKTFFKDEAAWRESLPNGGEITVTEPQLSEKALKALCLKPLVMMTDGGKLEELEKRFPGAKMVLTTDKMQLEIESMNASDINHFRIYSPTTYEIHRTFSDFGASKKPNLMAEWRGLYICLSHLF
jgi:hypothetical protein